MVATPFEPDEAAYRAAKARLAAKHHTVQPPEPPGASSAVPGPPVPVRFVGTNYFQAGTIVPSDSTGAIGPTEYVELVNDAFAIWDRTGGVVLPPAPLTNLVGAPDNVCSTGSLSDPQIMWDPTTNRFYYVVLNFNANPNELCVGFSKTNTPVATDDFCHYQFGFDYGTNVPDYPKLGDSKTLLIIGVNVVSSGGSYQGSDVDTITKPPGTGPISTCPDQSSLKTWQATHIKNADGSDGWTPVPASEVDTSTTGWVVATPDVSGGGSFDYLTVYSVTVDGNGNPVLGSPQTVSVSPYTLPPDAPQKGSSIPLDTMDGRLTNAVGSVDPANNFNQMAIWTQHTIEATFGSTVAWYEISPSPVYIVQQGSIPLPPGVTTGYIFNGAISSDRKVSGGRAAFGSDMAVGFNLSSDSTYVSDQVVSQVGTRGISGYTPVYRSFNAFQSPTCLQGPRNPDDCPWGDYSGASPDPAGKRGAVWFTNAWVGASGKWATENWEAITGGIAEYPVPGSYLPPSPTGITKGPDGNLWFAEPVDNAIFKVTPNGSFTPYPIPAQISEPQSIAVGSDGNLWFTEWGTNAIGKLTLGGAFTEYTIPTSNSQPYGIAAGTDGNLWFTEEGGNKIGRITTSGSFTEFDIPTADSTPGLITAGPDGRLWFTERNSNMIAAVTMSGAFTEWPTPAINSEPYGITAGPDGNVWFTEIVGGNVGKITPTGSFTEYPLPDTGSGPYGITAGPGGALWFTELAAGTIGKITTSGVLTEFATPATHSAPYGITGGPDGNVWFTESGTGNIGKLILH